MKNTLLISALISVQSLNAQGRFVSPQFEDDYDWFQEQSQVDKLYSDNSTLYIFTEKAAVRQGPCQASAAITYLPAGFSVQNIAYADGYYFPEDEVDGYGDIWYHVYGKDAVGQSFVGYIWGASIAKGWRFEDLDEDGKAEFLMLGVSSQARKGLRDIKAEIRILQNGKIQLQQQVPGLCVFEDCETSPLLRVIHSPQGFTIVEASTMAVGCWAGIEKAFFYWDGYHLQRVYHAEYTTHHEFANESFVVNSTSGTQLCQYSHEDESHVPVWKCKTIRAGGDSRAAIAMGDIAVLQSR
ncbi:MAG: hypothetical protein KDC66_07990 [Phaeodactylibacter sp.]|nr:hypothetical protein [Phaeodactylibacter sp.]MCB9274022.1 hypothetical protein [Lewinellaceae bacterium]